MTYFKYENDYHENDNDYHTKYSEADRISLALTYLVDLEDLDLYEVWLPYGLAYGPKRLHFSHP